MILRLTDKKIKEVFDNKELDKFPFMESLRAICDAQIALFREAIDKVENKYYPARCESEVLLYHAFESARDAIKKLTEE